MCTHSFDHITSKWQKTTTTTMMMNECNLYALLLRLCTWTRLKVYCGKNKCIEWMMITKKKVSWWWWYGWTVRARKKKQVLRLTYLDSVSLREGRFHKKISKMMIHRRKKYIRKFSCNDEQKDKSIIIATPQPFYSTLFARPFPVTKLVF